MSKRPCSLLVILLSLSAGAGCKSSRSSCDTAPAAPAGLAAPGTSTGMVVLSWTAPAAGENCSIRTYQVSVDGDAAVTSDTTTAAVTGLEPGTTHTFAVAAVNQHGVSEPSDPIEVTTPAAPDFGPHTLIFDTSMETAKVQAAVDAVYDIEHTAQFGIDRYALLFKPGTYDVDVPVGFYTQVSGLGALPGDVVFTRNVHSEAAYGWQPKGEFNATQNFWRAVENFTVIPLDLEPGATGFPNTMRWAVSQACPFRRMHVEGNMHLHHWWGWASGGWMADSVVDGQVVSGSQQQWVSRNASFGSWSEVNWNMVFVGDVNPFVPSDDGWVSPSQHSTVIERTPLVREKPFLYVDAEDAYQVYLPSVQADTKGTSWSDASQTPGTVLSIDDFYVARPSDEVSTLNAVLAAGKSLLFTPGIYYLDDTIRVTQPDTVVLGLGFATLHPNTGLPAMTVADVDGVVVAGLLFDAGVVNSPVLLEVGEAGSAADHSANPITLHDLFFRVGGAEAGKADVGLIINSHDVIGDHFWIWRADHGAGVGWTENPSTNGLVVNGDDVTIYGLFNEHFEQYQTLWNGNGGRVYFYQSEDPYDVPDQASWMSAGGTKNGYASYKVADQVTSHEAWGLGVYSVFNVFAGDQASAIEVPNTPNVKLHHMITFGLSLGTITHVVNDQGATATADPWAQGEVKEYPIPSP